MYPLHCSSSPRRAPHAELALLPTMIGLFLLTACASADAPGGFTNDGASRTGPCVLNVQNHSWTDLILFAVLQDGTRVRLGPVRSMEVRRVTLPKALMGARNIRLLAVPAVLGESYLTESVMLEPGTTLNWQLNNHLALSTLAVR